MIKQYRTAVKKQLLVILAATMDVEGESTLICAQSELAEEACFKAKSLIKLFECYLVPGYCNEYMHFYLAQELYAAPLPPDDDEDIEIVRMSPGEAKNKLLGGEIRDVKTALGITLAMERLRFDGETLISAHSHK